MLLQRPCLARLAGPLSFALALGLVADASAFQSAPSNPARSLAARAKAAGANVVNLRNVPLNQTAGFLNPISGAPLSPVQASPFQELETTLMRRAEVGVFMSSADGVSPGGSSYLLDDTAAGEGLVPGTLDSSAAPRNIRDAVAADVDEDGEDEVLAIETVGPFTMLWQIDYGSSGTAPTWTLVREFLHDDPGGFVTARLVVGDLDGDRRDEIAIFRTIGEPHYWSNTSTLWVLDDATSGAGLLLERNYPYNDTYGVHARYFGVTADLDADGDDELIVARQGQSGTKGKVRFSMYDWSHGSESLERVVNSQSVYTDPGTSFGLYMVSKAAAGQLDGDPAEEIVLASSTPKLLLSTAPTGYVKFVVDQLNYNQVTQRFDFVQRANYSGACEATPIPEYCFDVATVDRFGDGDDWIALLRKPTGEGGDSDMFCLRQDLDSGGWDSVRVMDSVPTLDDAVSLRAGDADGDGAEELFAGFSYGTGDTKYDWITRVEAGETPSQRTLFTPGSVTSTATSPTQPLALAVGEFDGDGLLVEFEGTELRVSNPVPLTLLAAAPSKAGIAQNYSSTSTTYSVATGSGFETEYSTSTTISGKAGFEVEDLTGTFGGSVKATMESESRTSNAISSTTTLVTGYEGGSEADVIVFASNQYRVHSYRILNADDPDVIGKEFTIDVPIGTRISKWTVPFYNQAVAPRYQMGDDLLPHTVGDPSSYRGFNEMSQVIHPFVSWRTQGTLAVGQGTGGSVSMAIELATEVSDSRQTEMSVGTEASFKAWGATVEASISAGVGAAYTVSTNEATTFEGRLGDIAAADFPDWSYAAGMVVYQAGRIADDDNLPDGWLPGSYPLTVIDYWVDPYGAGY